MTAKPNLPPVRRPGPPSRGRAKVLRKNMTDAETKLWWELRELKEQGFYFRRQVPLGNYVADFACLKYNLIVEVDGGHHAEGEQFAHDRKRDAWLASEGFKVMRFWNSDVLEHMTDTVDAIVSKLIEISRTKALPLEGGGAAKGGGGGDLINKGKAT